MKYYDVKINVTEDADNYIRRIENKYFALICSYCKHVEKFSIDSNITIMHENKRNPNFIYMRRAYNFECSNCGCRNYNKEPFDANIADIIVELNKKGYETLFCCEGHIDDLAKYDYKSKEFIYRDCESIGYISFDTSCSKSIDELCKHPLPKEWYIDRENYQFSIRVKTPQSDMRTRIKSIRKWVNELPNLNEGENDG